MILDKVFIILGFLEIQSIKLVVLDIKLCYLSIL